MKVKVQNIAESFEPLSSLAEKKLGFDASFLVANNILAMQGCFENFQKQRLEIIQTFGEKDEAGEIIQDDQGNIKIENAEGFNQAIMELLECDVEISVTPLKKSMFAELKIEPRELLPLLYLFDGEQE